MKRQRLLLLCVVPLVIGGCAAYRTDSNISIDQSHPVSASRHVQILAGQPSGRKYRVLGPIEVSVKKLTIFHDNQTKEQADQALVERARAIGADAVMEVTYESGIGFTTWGYMDAKGTAVKFEQ